MSDANDKAGCFVVVAIVVCNVRLKFRRTRRCFLHTPKKDTTEFETDRA